MEPHHSSSGGRTSYSKVKRAQSSEPSCVSVKRFRSIANPPEFSRGGEPSCVSMKSDQSMGKPPIFSSGGGGEPSCVSVKSDQSMGKPPIFSSGGGGEPSCVSVKSDQSVGKPPIFSSGGGGEPSCVSVKSDQSMGKPPIFSSGGGGEPSCVSVKSDQSMGKPPIFSSGGGGEPSCVSVKSDQSMGKPPIFSSGGGGEPSCVSVKSDQSMGKPPIFSSGGGGEPSCVSVKSDQSMLEPAQSCGGRGTSGSWRRSTETALQINTLADIYQPVDDVFHRVLERHKTSMKNKYESLFEGIKTEQNKTLLNRIYTQLYIIEGESEGVNEEHEVLQMEKTSRKHLQDIPINCLDIFKPLQGPERETREENIRAVKADNLRHKERKEDNRPKEPELRTVLTKGIAGIGKTVSVQKFILDWAEGKANHDVEFMFVLSFRELNLIKDDQYSVQAEGDSKNLLESNRTILLKLAELAFKQLMKGNVMFYEEDLKESSIEVTEASVYSGIFTEIFREECVLYQRKVYCFVHLSVQEFLAAVYVFLCYEVKNMEELQIFKLLNRERSENVSLDEVLEGAVNEAVRSQNGHLDLFLRFLVGISLESNHRLLQGLLTSTQISSERTRKYIKRLIKGEDQQYPISTDRSINLFLCLSEMNDQSLSREIQKFLKSEKHSDEKLSPGQCSALACMLLTSEEVLDELDLKKYNTSKEGYRRLIPALTVCRKARLNCCYITKDCCDTLCATLQSVNCPVKELDLSNNDLQDSGVELLSAGLKSLHCKLEILRLTSCSLNTNSGETISSVLQSVNSSLKELDLSNNDLQDSGVELLSTGLKNSHCKLEKLRLYNCSLGRTACENLGSALQSANISLKELDLSNNDLQDSGVEPLCVGLKNSYCKLETLRLSGCMVTDEGCSFLASALKSNPSHLRELDLTYNHPAESGVKLLSDLLEDPQCTLTKLQVDHGGKIRVKPGPQKYVCDLTLDPNTVSSRLSLSEKNRKVESMREGQRHPDHPDRFETLYTWFSVILNEFLHLTLTGSQSALHAAHCSRHVSLLHLQLCQHSAHLSQYRVDVRLAALLGGGGGWRFNSGILSLNLVLSAFIMTQSDVVHTDRLSLQQTAAQQHQQRNSSHP
ncbi:hypothetical protein SRHO_G00276200 [Serrasalmus rhombeus]